MTRSDLMALADELKSVRRVLEQHALSKNGRIVKRAEDALRLAASQPDREDVAQSAADYLFEELTKLDAPVSYTACKALVTAIAALYAEEAAKKSDGGVEGHAPKCEVAGVTVGSLIHKPEQSGVRIAAHHGGEEVRSNCCGEPRLGDTAPLTGDGRSAGIKPGPSDLAPGPDASLGEFVEAATWASRSALDSDTVFCEIYTPGYPPNKKGSFGFYVKDLRKLIALSRPAASVAGATFTIDHDGFTGTVQGYYATREGKRGVVLQQVGTRVVHVYGEKWLVEAKSSAAPNDGAKDRDGGRAVIEGDAVVVRFPFDAMQGALDGAWGMNIFDKRQKITDLNEFAKEFRNELNSESENGTTLIHRMADQAFITMIEQGAFGFDVHEDQSP